MHEQSQEKMLTVTQSYNNFTHTLTFIHIHVKWVISWADTGSHNMWQNDQMSFISSGGWTPLCDVAQLVTRQQKKAEQNST